MISQTRTQLMDLIQIQSMNLIQMSSFFNAVIYVRIFACMLSHVQLFEIHGLQPARLCPRNFPGKNTGVRCHFVLQGIFLTQGSNPHLLHWQVDSLPVSHLGNSSVYLVLCNFIACVQGCVPITTVKVQRINSP